MCTLEDVYNNLRSEQLIFLSHMYVHIHVHLYVMYTRTHVTDVL